MVGYNCIVLVYTISTVTYYINMNVIRQFINLYSLFLKARICSSHFVKSDFEKPLIELMLDYSPKCKRKLKSDAIPTQRVVILNKIITILQ